VDLLVRISVGEGQEKAIAEKAWRWEWMMLGCGI
jgi:hypothetical protein